MDCKNRIAIVTGASSGVGEATAKLLAERGAKVVLAARSGEKLERLKQQLGEQALVVPTDVSSLEACEQLILTTVEQFGGLDILVNNAGYHARGDFEEISTQELDHTLDVNLRAPMRLTHLALPYLLKSEQAAIINVASLAGRFPVDGEATYSTTKFGLRAFSLALSEELRFSHVQVSIVSPGPIDTGFIMDDIDGVADLVFSQPMSTAEEIAESICQCIDDGKVERAVPAVSGVLATAGYLMPALRRGLKPLLERQGRRAKMKYKARNEQQAHGA